MPRLHLVFFGKLGLHLVLWLRKRIPSDVSIQEELPREEIGNLTKAKEIIKDLLRCLPEENIEGVYEITEEAEQFLRESERQ